MNTGHKGAIIVISSHVVRGSVGNRAAVFALETLGHSVWAVPTVILPWHPGHGSGTRLVPDVERFAAMLRDLEESPWLGEVTGVLSGYIGGPEQAAAIASLVRSVKLRNRDAIYLCDPVIGDEGGLYVSESIATQIRDRLLPLADVATPNRHELAWLSGTRFGDAQDVARAAEALGPSTMLVTSAPCDTPGSTGSMLLTAGEVLLAKHQAVAGPPNGLGDLTAALFLARKLGGQGNAEALHDTTSSVFEVLARAAKRGANELMLATDASSLSDPTAPVHLSRL